MEREREGWRMKKERKEERKDSHITYSPKRKFCFGCLPAMVRCSYTTSLPCQPCGGRSSSAELRSSGCVFSDRELVPSIDFHSGRGFSFVLLCVRLAVVRIRVPRRHLPWFNKL